MIIILILKCRNQKLLEITNIYVYKFYRSKYIIWKQQLYLYFRLFVCTEVIPYQLNDLVPKWVTGIEKKLQK